MFYCKVQKLMKKKKVIHIYMSMYICIYVIILLAKPKVGSLKD